MKKVLKLLLIMIAFIPVFLYATETYSDAVLRANNYTNDDNYSTKNKFLIYGAGTPYAFINNRPENNSSFRNGGLINADEFKLSKKKGFSYLLSGSPFWTMTPSSSGQFAVGVYDLQSEEANSRVIKLDTRVTQYVKPTTRIEGSGRFSDPWYFVAGYNVKVTSSDKDHGTFIYNGEETDEIDDTVDAGGMFELSMKISTGYRYTGLDDCGFTSSATNTNTYVIPRVIRDVNCRAHFGEKVYKFTLKCENCSTEPDPDKMFFKFNTGWYKVYNSDTDRVGDQIFTIVPPTKAGYNFKGYKYNNVTVIAENGSVSNIPSNKMVDNSTNQVLTPDWQPRTDTRYVVKHYKVDCNGTSRTLAETSEYQGTTDSEVEAPTKSYTGFNVPTKKKVTIKGDGSAVVEYEYTRKEFTVSVAKGTGISSVSGAGTYKYGCNYTLSATVKSGYKWKNYTGSSTLTSQSPTIAMGTSNVSYTANAEGITYYVKYNKNDSDATGTMSNSTHVYGTAKNLTANAFTKSGFSFNGWSTSANGNIEYTDGESVSDLMTTDGGTFNLYAKYSIQNPATPTISGAATKIYGSSNTTLTCATATTYPSGAKIYYSFGYATSDGGTPSNWSSASETATFTISSTAYVAARYYSCRVYVSYNGTTTSTITSAASADAAVIINNAAITFDVNGAVISGTRTLYTKTGVSVVYTGIRNTTQGTIPKAGKKGTSFDGWYTAASGGSKVVNADGSLVTGTVSGYVASGKWTATTNITLYAHNTTCVAGTYNVSDSTFVCTDCPAGYYCTGGTNRTACPKGTYRTATKGKTLNDCTKCPGCQSTPGTAQTSNTCVWNSIDGSLNNVSQGYRGKLGIVEDTTCHTNVRNVWNQSYGTPFGNYGTWDWETINNHGMCSDDAISTIGFHQYFTASMDSWLGVCTVCGFTNGKCNKGPLTAARVQGSTAKYGIQIKKGTNNYSFTVPAGNTVWFNIRLQGCAVNIQIKNVKFKINNSYYTPQQMVDNGYVEKLFIIGGIGYSGKLSAAYTGGDFGRANYPEIDYVFTLKSGYQLNGFQAYSSADTITTGKVDGGICSDGYYYRYLNSKYFRMVLK